MVSSSTNAAWKLRISGIQSISNCPIRAHRLEGKVSMRMPGLAWPEYKWKLYQGNDMLQRKSSRRVLICCMQNGVQLPPEDSNVEENGHLKFFSIFNFLFI